MKDVNLRAMLAIGEAFNVKVGYSDHTLGIEVPVAAVALGASVIEKHFTLDKKMVGPDHAASLDPSELKKMVESIRNIESAVAGSGLKEPSNSEIKNRLIARKSIHLAKALNKGDKILYEDLEMLRPGDGISPMKLDIVVGKYVNKDMEVGRKLSMEDFKS
jgi:N-acetylneuraminate synthase/N,N'-diacetyllegionaminate synthase